MLNRMRALHARASGTVLISGEHVLGEFNSRVHTPCLTQCTNERRNAALYGRIADGGATEFELPRKVAVKGAGRMFKRMLRAKPVA